MFVFLKNKFTYLLEASKAHPLPATGLVVSICATAKGVWADSRFKYRDEELLQKAEREVEVELDQKVNKFVANKSNNFPDTNTIINFYLASENMNLQTLKALSGTVKSFKYAYLQVVEKKKIFNQKGQTDEDFKEWMIHRSSYYKQLCRVECLKNREYSLWFLFFIESEFKLMTKVVGSSWYNILLNSFLF